MPSIKIEPHPEANRSPPYDFSPSPGSSIPYSDFQSGVPSPPLLPYDTDRRPSFESDQNRNGGSTLSYSSSSTAPTMSFHHHPDSASSYSNGSSGYDPSEFGDDVFAQRFAANSSPVPQFCACRTNPGIVHTLIPLNNELQNATSALRQYPSHTPDSHCLLFRRIAELNNLMQYVFPVFPPLVS